MKKTALVAAALLVTMGSGMAFASTYTERMDDIKFNQRIQEFRAARLTKYLTDDQVAQIEELASNYENSVAGLRKETIELRSEIAGLEDEEYPDYDLIYTLETELWEKMGQLTAANETFQIQAKEINPAFPYAVKVF